MEPYFICMSKHAHANGVNVPTPVFCAEIGLNPSQKLNRKFSVRTGSLKCHSRTGENVNSAFNPTKKIKVHLHAVSQSKKPNPPRWSAIKHESGTLDVILKALEKGRKSTSHPPTRPGEWGGKWPALVTFSINQTSSRTARGNENKTPVAIMQP